MDPLVNYLKNLHDYHNKINEYEAVRIILGNESCDLDSTISSISLAFYFNKLNETSNKNIITLPVMSVTKDEFIMRTENCYCLKKSGIDINWLLYGDIDLKTVIDKLEVCLVDHHVLNKKNEYLFKYVTQIFDHRPVDTNVNWNKDNVKIRIEQVGSCATLIADEILKDTNQLTHVLATLLYETINFDTIGFKLEAGKVKDLDLKVADVLEKYLNNNKGRTCIFNELWLAHNDVSHLTPKQLLLKDLKVVNSVYIPGLPMLVEKYLKLPNVMQQLEEFCLERNCSVIVLMGLEATNVLSRDLAFYTLNDNNLMETIIQGLLEMEILQLQERDIGLVDVKYFFQQNSKLSRKQILPVIKELLMK